MLSCKSKLSRFAWGKVGNLEAQTLKEFVLDVCFFAFSVVGIMHEEVVYKIALVMNIFVALLSTG